MKESLQILDNIRLNFNPDGLLVLNITLALIMFGVALEIKLKNFRDIFLMPKPFFTGFFSQFLMLPLFTFLLVVLLNRWITPTIAMGMILVASCPGGNVSNFISSLAKGNVALSVTLTATATLSALMLTPLNFALYGSLYVKFISITNSDQLLQPLTIPLGQVFQTVFILLGIPLFLGMLVNWKFPRFTKIMMKPIRIFSIISFTAMVVLAFINNYEYFWANIKYIFLLVLVQNSMAFLIGYLFSLSFKLNRQNCRTISIETGIQNSGLALVLLFNPKIFPPELAIGGMAFIAAWWGIWHILAGLGIASLWSYRKITAPALKTT